MASSSNKRPRSNSLHLYYDDDLGIEVSKKRSKPTTNIEEEIEESVGSNDVAGKVIDISDDDYGEDEAEYPAPAPFPESDNSTRIVLKKIELGGGSLEVGERRWRWLESECPVTLKFWLQQAQKLGNFQGFSNNHSRLD